VSPGAPGCPGPGWGCASPVTGSPIALPTFLRLAEVLAAALRGLHEGGLIHRDINPANILVSDSMSHVRLTGFGASSRLLRERQAPTPPELIAGTLPYMAPEQTGPMNRSMDAGSDLYSLGVTLYQMRTGRSPSLPPIHWNGSTATSRAKPWRLRIAALSPSRYPPSSSGRSSNRTVAAFGRRRTMAPGRR
jgi:serine/threonine protein kinase